MKKAKVVFDYEPQEDDELSLKVGDIIFDVEKADVGWCSGFLNGKKGMFPDNFVELFEEEEKKVPAPPSASKKPQKKKVKKMKVNFPYVAENPDEISLEAGEVIEIIKDVEDGWAEGKNSKGKTGVFPTNFGDVVEEEEPAEADLKQEEVENKQNEDISASRKVKGIGFGNIFGDGPIKLRQRSIKDSDKPKNVSTPSKAVTPSKEKEFGFSKSKETTPVKPKDTSPSKARDLTPGKDAKPKKTLNYCKATFDYEKDNDDELSLKKGEVIIILDKDLADEGWWEGEKIEESGKRSKGVFPDNFVVEMTAEEAREYERQNQPEAEPVKDVKVLKPKDSKKSSLPPPPSQSSKPTANSVETLDSDLSFNEPTTSEHTLNQIKRPGGPKNRRKPGASERREKAASSAVGEEIPEPSDSEGEVKQEKSPEPVKKKESMKRGIPVLPGMGGAGDSPSTEVPSWLQSLKNRQSTKKGPPQTSPAKETSDTPPWLANLKKRQSTESAAPKAALQPKTEKPPTVPTSKPAAKPPPASPTEKPLTAWQLERQQKALKPKTAESNEEKAPEPPADHPSPPASDVGRKSGINKRPPAPKAATESQSPPPAPVKKPPAAIPVSAPATSFKSKPAPPKSKPAPAAKPASSAVVEELKNEVKALKEEIEKIKNEFKKEVSRLDSELRTEVEQRISLQEEVRNLRRNLPS